MALSLFRRVVLNGSSRNGSTSLPRTRWSQARFYSMTVALLLASLALASPAVPATAAQEGGSGPVTTTTIQRVGRMSWDEMLELEARTPRVLQAPRVMPRMLGPAPREIDLTPVQPIPPAAAAAIEPPPDEREARGPFAMTRTFVALGDNNAGIPPDTMGAVGPNHLMTMINTQVRIQDKSGVNISTVSLSTFWGPSTASSPFDPKVIYDPLSDRWIATIDDEAQSGGSGVPWAISDTSDPTGSWDFYYLDADSANICWADFPGIGVNDTHIVLTNNMFAVSDNAYCGTKMWVMDKEDALAGDPVLTTEFEYPCCIGDQSVDGFTLKPVQSFESSPGVLYVVDNSGWGASGVPAMRLSQVTGSAGASASWSVVAGGLYPGTGLFFVANDFEYGMIGASQPGTSTLIDTGDTRMTDPVQRNGHIWAVHSAGLPNGGLVDRTAAFWYEIDPTAMDSGPIVQSGVLSPGTNSHYSYPSIVANKNDDAAMGFSHANSTTYIEEMAAGRASTDTAGTMRTPYVIRAGEDTYVKDFGSGLVRWGDYSATRVDPTDDTTFWSIQQRAVIDVGPGASDDRWETNWSRNQRSLNFFEGDEEDDALAAAFRAYLERLDLGWLVAEEEAPKKSKLPRGQEARRP